jgi:hypothetical protein
MAGFIPAIHVLGFMRKKVVDGRDKPGHDQNGFITKKIDNS